MGASRHTGRQKTMRGNGTFRMGADGKQRDIMGGRSAWVHRLQHVEPTNALSTASWGGPGGSGSEEGVLV